MSDAVAAVTATIARHGAPAPGETVLAMVSGGADSLFMLHALARLHDGHLHVLTCDHGLRAEAGAECALVEAAAAGLGIPCTRVELALRPGPALQRRARDARRQAARREAARVGASAVALAHTADDLAETVLMRLARGTGPGAVHGMTPRDGELVRPVLDVRRAATRAWCRDHGVAFADDPSNQDPAYARVRARALVAALDDVSPGAATHLARFAALARDESDVLDALAADALGRATSDDGVRVAALQAEPAAVQRRVVRMLLARAGAAEDGRGADAVEAVRRFAPRVDVAGGVCAVVERGVLRVVPQPLPDPPDAPGTPQALDVPGCVRLPGWSVRARRGIAGDHTPRRIAVRDERPLSVRGAADGDRIALPGGGHAAVGRLLAGAGVPSRLRARVPVVLAGDVLIWVAGHRAAAGVLAPVGASATVLELEDE